MNEEIISFETAKMVKEKGFSGFYAYRYNPNGVLMERWFEVDFESEKETISITDIVNEEDIGLSMGYIPASTQSLVQKWLREIHKISIVIAPSIKGENKWYYNITKLDNIEWISEPELQSHDSYESALEVAIQVCLKIV